MVKTKFSYPGRWEGNKFYANTGRSPIQKPLTFGGYGNPQPDTSKTVYQARTDGKVFCPKHPGTFYDPNRYTECFRCHEERMKSYEKK